MSTTDTRSGAPQLPFTYVQFADWYDTNHTRFFEPARAAAVRALEEILDRELREPERVRVDVRPGRIKSKGRAWQKLNQKYAERVGSLGDVPKVMDDIVGLRIVCTNSSDLQRVLEIVSALDEWEEGELPVLAVVRDSKRDYVSSPKASGYRAHHVNLCTAVSWADNRHPVVCELQVRTLLQDSWGELTHEDTYKPGTRLPPLVDTLSRRLASFMATLDEIAQDLRDEMDRISDEVAEDEERGAAEEPGAVPTTREAVSRYVAERIASLERPLDLASLAWELQREFGRDVADGWLGHGTFKNLIVTAVPSVRLSQKPPAYVLPEGFSAEVYSDVRNLPDVPRAAELLNGVDRGFPLVRKPDWGRIYSALSQATYEVAWQRDAGLQTVNELTRVARDRDGLVGGRPLARRYFDYVAKALMFAHALEPRMTPEAIADIFVDWTVSRTDALELRSEEVDEFREWLGAPGECPA